MVRILDIHWSRDGEYVFLYDSKFNDLGKYNKVELLSIVNEADRKLILALNGEENYHIKIKIDYKNLTS